MDVCVPLLSPYFAILLDVDVFGGLEGLGLVIEELHPKRQPC